jgi:hypothetical protein
MPAHGLIYTRWKLRAAVHATLSFAILSVAWDKQKEFNPPSHFLSSSMAKKTAERCSTPKKHHSMELAGKLRVHRSCSPKRHGPRAIEEALSCLSPVGAPAHKEFREIQTRCLACGMFRVLQLRGAGDDEENPGSSELEDEYLISGLDDVDPEDGITSSMPDEASM